MAQKYADVFGFNKFTDWTFFDICAKVEDVEPGRLHVPDGVDLVDPENVGWNKIFAYDSKYAGGINRESYVKAWMTSPAAHAKVRLSETVKDWGLGTRRTPRAFLSPSMDPH